MRCRIKVGGGAAGHNGLRSLNSSIDKEYYRLRVGIDRPALKAQVSDYVLSPFSKQEQEQIADFLEHCVTNLPSLLEANFDAFLSAITKE